MDTPPPVPPGTRTLVLVEGLSDAGAVDAAARRRGLDLSARGVAVVAIGGSKGIRGHLERHGPRGQGLRLTGLCDAAEAGDYARGLERAGLGSELSRDAMEELGFFICVRDLEDELIRALGPPAVERVLEDADDVLPFRTFQRQPGWVGRPIEEQLRRYLGTTSGRKIRMAPLLAGALPPSRLPRPLARLLDAL